MKFLNSLITRSKYFILRNELPAFYASSISEIKLLQNSIKMLNHLKRRERRKDRMSGGSLESMESNYNSQNTNDAVTLKFGSDTKSDKNELNISNIEIHNEECCQLDFDSYKKHVDKQFDEKKNLILKNFQFSSNADEDEKKIKEELEVDHKRLITEEDKLFNQEKDSKIKFFKEDNEKKYELKIEEVRKRIDKITSDNIKLKGQENNNLNDRIKNLQNSIESIKDQIAKLKDEQASFTESHLNNYEEEIKKIENENKINMKAYSSKLENDFNIKKQHILNDYSKKISDLKFNKFDEGFLSQNEINEINNIFQDIKQNLILENEEKIFRYRNDIINNYNSLLKEEKIQFKASLHNSLKSIQNNLDEIKEYYKMQIERFNVENEIYLFTKIPNKINDLIKKNNEMFESLSKFNKLVFEKVYKELENNKQFSKVINKEKIYSVVFEYFWTLIIQIVLDYLITDNKDISNLLDKLIEKITTDLDVILFTISIDRRIKLNFAINDPNLIDD